MARGYCKGLDYKIVVGTKSRYRKTLEAALSYAERRAKETGRAEVYRGYRGSKWRRVKIIEVSLVE